MNTKKISIGDFEIGGDRTFIVADIGSNHRQDLTLAKESIDAATEAGVDAVKFQSIQLNELYLKPDESTAAFVKQLEFPEDWHFKLKRYCDNKGILFFSSPTYLRAVDLLEEAGIELYKLASAQISTFPQIVEKVAKLNKPTIFSTGIATYEEVINAVKTFKKYGNEKFIILHCNSIYPTPPEQVNIQMISTYESMFNNPVGFSDHTIGTHIACLAVSMGASVIEKHFTLDKNMDTPDSNDFACDPTELESLVRQIRDVEDAMKGFEDRIDLMSEEESFKNKIKYCIIANDEIATGSVIRETDLKYLRSDVGINCKNVKQVIGKKAVRTIKSGELITDEKIR